MNNEKGIMKNEERGSAGGMTLWLFFSAFCFFIFLLSCNDPFQPGGAPIKTGYGKVNISFTYGPGRTAYPSKVFDSYIYTFTLGGEGAELAPGTDGLFTLEVGEWRVDVKAYIGGGLAAEGSGEFTVTSGVKTDVTVVLDAAETDGFGTFTFTVRYPAGAAAEITMLKLPSLSEGVAITPDSTETAGGYTVITGTAEDVPAGFYLLTVQVSDGGWHAGRSEAVHVYPLLDTPYSVEFSAEDLLPTVVSIAGIKGIIPEAGQTLPAAIAETEQYTGAIVWTPNHAAFAANTQYTAAITLALKNGYTLKGVPANFFTVPGAASVGNAAGTGAVTAVFTIPDSYLKVRNTQEWESALVAVIGGGDNKTYLIDVEGDVGVSGVISNSFGNVNNIAVTLIGDGKLYLTSMGRIIRIGAGQTLVIDSGDLVLEGMKNGQNGSSNNNNASAVYVSGTDSKLELKNGAINNNSDSNSNGGGVIIDSNGAFTMSGGTISGNTGYRGGAVYADYNGTFTMTGGIISGNTSNNYSGGVGNNGTFIMTGGTISGNTGNSAGGGVYNMGGTFTMDGGEISGNAAPVNTSGAYGGGGVYVGNSVFIMNGGIISGNTTNSSGGGVYVNNSTFIMTGGTVSGNTADNYNGGGVMVYSGTFTVGGAAKIYGNLKSGAANNIYLRSGYYITLAGGPDAPAEGMNVWAQTETTSGVIVNSGASAGTAQYFHADQAGWGVMLQNVSQLAIVQVMGAIAAPVWRETTEISLTAPTVYLSATAQDWQISGGGGSWSGFTATTADMSMNGKYLRYYAVIGGVEYYSNTVTIRVVSLTAREVTIDMYDSYGDSWNGCALRINVNGTNLDQNATITSGSQASYNFLIDTGDVVKIYWVSGSYASEVGFAVYYADDPPDPAFSPNSGSTVDSGRLLLYAQYGNVSSTGNGAELVSFSLP